MFLENRFNFKPLWLSQRCRHTSCDIIFCLPAAEASPSPTLDKSISMETISVKLLTSVQPKAAPSSQAAAAAAGGLCSQDQALGHHWYPAANLSEEPTACKHGAGSGIAAPCYTR